MMVAGNGYEDIVVLIEKGCNIEAQDDYGRTAIMYASSMLPMEREKRYPGTEKTD